MRVELTKSQRAAVEHRGSSLLVAASAGSGKTEVLARRCAGLIADAQRPVEVDRLLVVTFTRAAASELRARVARMLGERLSGASDAKLRRHLRRQIVLIDTADIGTIDAWCGRLVREHYVEAGIDPAFGVLGEEQAALLRQEVLEALLEWVYTADDEAAARGRDWISTTVRPGDAFLREMLLALHRYREHLVSPEAWFTAQREFVEMSAGQRREHCARSLAEGLRRDCAFYAEQLPEILRGIEDRRAVASLEVFGSQLTAWCERLGRPEELGDIAADIGGCKIDLPTRPKLDGPDRTVFDEIRERWLKHGLQGRWNSDEIAAVLDGADAAAGRLGTLLDLEARYARDLDAAKQARAAYEFGDVLRLALRLLGDTDKTGGPRPTAIAERLRERYEHVLIDEYQDTSPLQVELLRLVSRARPSNRFMVGDIKQSIYGFREAEPRLFAEQMRAFDAGTEQGASLLLTDNFRSHARVVDGVNAVFRMLFDPALGGTAYGPDEELHARRDEIENPGLDAGPRLLVRVVPEAGRGDTDDRDDAVDGEPLERIEREGRVIAREVHAMFNAGVQAPRRDESGALQLSPLRPSDIVILLRSAKGNATLLSQMLRRAGIANVAIGRESVLDCQEVRDVRNVLRLLVNRGQDLTWAAFLRGPLAGLRERDLLEVRRAAPQDGFAEAVEKCASDGVADCAEAIRAACARLDRWSTLACETELPALLHEILREGALLEFAQALPGGEHRVAMLHAFEALAADFAARGEHGVGEFVEFLDQIDAGDLQPTASAAVDEDVVRIMTIHAAKGLEFPVVFLAAAGARLERGGPGGRLLCDERWGVGLHFHEAVTRKDLRTPAYPLLMAEARRRDREEELRLLYVAATRARERLFVVGHAPPDMWDHWRARCFGDDGPPPLSSRLAARSMLEWVLMGAAANGLDAAACVDVAYVSAEAGATVPRRVDVGRAERAGDPPLSAVEDAWVAASFARITHPDSSAVAGLPAAVSVSVLKRRGVGDDEESAALLDFAPALAGPRFAATRGRDDGRAYGSACHRFLECAALDQLRTADDVRRQIDELVRAGRLPPEEAALLAVDDIAWLGASELIAELTAADARLRREAPFTYTLAMDGVDERILLRGVIDALIESPAGLHVIDYKTDRPRNAMDRAERIAQYAVQLQLYAVAGGAVFGRPVASARLVMLAERQLVDVPVDAAATRGVVHRLLAALRTPAAQA